VTCTGWNRSSRPSAPRWRPWRWWRRPGWAVAWCLASPKQHGGRTLAGVWVRVAQRLLALATGIWWNWEIGAADKRSLVAYDR
jgi:hypothetical protein